ncbi:MAG: hypothetical protein AAF441_08050 [Pseudomonadota bacterium]
MSVFAAAIFFAIGLMLPTGAIATGGNGGGGNGGGDGLHNRDRVKKQPRSRRRGTIRKRRTIKRKSRSRKSRSSSRRSAPAVPPAETVEQAAERASTSTKRCVRYNKQFVSRRICMRRMMTQFVKDLTANEKKLPKKTPAKVETVKEVIESMDRKDPKEETISALEKARSAFAVSMEVVTEEDPDGKEGYAKNLEAIENVLEEAYDALAQVG